jgi:hypothetical protein
VNGGLFGLTAWEKKLAMEATTFRARAAWIRALKVYGFLRTNEGSWFTVDEIATGLGFKQATVLPALTYIRKLPRIYEKTDPSGRRKFGFVRMAKEGRR